MALGNAFPKEFVFASIKRQLLPGTVVKFKAIMDDGKEHEKRYVILMVDDKTLTCVINSQIPKLIRSNPLLLQCQVSIDKAGHPFMDWDSHIDCSRVRHYPTDEVCEQLINNPEWVLGSVLQDISDEMRLALKFSPTETVAKIQSCCTSLESAQLPARSINSNDKC